MCNSFFNTEVVHGNKGCLEHFADTCFIPVRVLFNGKRISLIDDKVFLSEPAFAKRSFLKTVLAIICLPLGILFGTIPKFFAMLSKESRKNQKPLSLEFLKIKVPAKQAPEAPLTPPSTPESVRSTALHSLQSPIKPESPRGINASTSTPAPVIQVATPPGTPVAITKTQLNPAFDPPLDVPFVIDGDDSADQKATYNLVKTKLMARPELAIKFDDDKLSITFSHHLHEIHAIIAAEKLQDAFAKDLSIVKPKNNKLRGAAKRNLLAGSTFSIAESAHADFKDREKKLLEAADRFFHTRQINRVSINGIREESQIIPALFKDSKGICIGEKHKHATPKQWLITHMRKLKNHGVNTIFLEHIFHDSMQVNLDKYFNAPTNQPLPPCLEAYLDQLDEGHIEDPLYNFKHLVIAAKRAKIRIVAIDTTLSYYCGTNDAEGVTDAKKRFMAMNYVAVQIMEREMKAHPGKFVALMGSGHVSTCEGVKGVAELIGCPSLIIEDSRSKSTQCNVKSMLGEIAHATCVLQLPTTN